MSLLILENRYQNDLLNPRQRGEGAHSWVMTAANHGIMAKLTGEQVYSDIRLLLDRRVPDKEISDAVKKALQDHGKGAFVPQPRPEAVARNGNVALKNIIKQGKLSDEADIWDVSPVRLWNEPQEDPALFLQTRFNPDDLVWIGKHDDAGIIGKTIRCASDWIKYFQSGGQTFPHIIINPLNGIPTTTKSGDKTTLRGDGNVKSYRHVLVEFDNLSREYQLRFWSAIKLPIVALIDSGGKSIHAWLDVSKLAEVQTAEDWQEHIKNDLFDRILTPLGVDRACKNPARLSRLPGHLRMEKGKYQRLLWLSTQGISING